MSDDYEAGLARKRTSIGTNRFIVTRYVRTGSEYGMSARFERLQGYATIDECKQYVIGLLHAWEEEQDPDFSFSKGNIDDLRRPEVAGVERLFSGAVVLTNPSPSEHESVACYVEGCEVTADPILGDALFQHLNADAELRAYFIACR